MAENSIVDLGVVDSKFPVKVDELEKDWTQVIETSVLLAEKQLLFAKRVKALWMEAAKIDGDVRGGSTNLNSEISGNSGYNALTAMVRQTGVFHGQAEEEGRRCQTCTQAAHRRIQSAGGTCRVARGQNNGAVVPGI